jgi:hypothetical protein
MKMHRLVCEVCNRDTKTVTPILLCYPFASEFWEHVGVFVLDDTTNLVLPYLLPRYRCENSARTSFCVIGSYGSVATRSSLTKILTEL